MTDQKETYTIVVSTDSDSSQQQAHVFVNEELTAKEQNVLTHWAVETEKGNISIDVSTLEYDDDTYKPYPGDKMTDPQKWANKLHKMLQEKQHVDQLLPYMKKCKRWILLTFVH